MSISDWRQAAADHGCVYHSGVGPVVDAHRCIHMTVSFERGTRAVARLSAVVHHPVDAYFFLVIVDLADRLSVLSLQLLADQRMLSHLVLLILAVQCLG